MLTFVSSLCLVAFVTSQQPEGGDQGGAPDNNGGDNTGSSDVEYCDSDTGSDSTYTETIEDDSNGRFGKARRIVASGCPNYPTEPIGDNTNEAAVMDKDYLLEAYPCIADATYSLTAVGAEVGTTLNGISIFSPYPGPGYEDGEDAVMIEGDTFDECSGHSDNSGDYHYHVAPSCLLDQLDDYDGVTSHSPIIGWAFDGFPIYGPHGVDGSEIYACDHTDADSADCVDSCNGHDQHEQDGYLYHYHILGPIGDLVTTPTDPLPSSDMYPYTLGCLMGVPSDWDVLTGGEAGTSTCVSNGTAAGFVPQPMEGVTEVYDGNVTDSSSSGDSGNAAHTAKLSAGLVLAMFASLLASF